MMSQMQYVLLLALTGKFGTSVGSGAISIRWAIIIAAIMEFTGAVALGQAVGHLL
jgi:phosphate/sulfate permease